MKNIIKLIKQFISFVLLSIKKLAKFIVKNIEKFIGWYKYNYKYNRSKLLFSTVASIFLICAISLSVYRSYAKLGFNMNPITSEIGITDKWYKELLNINQNKLDNSYSVLSSNTSEDGFAGGSGTQNDPFLIATPGQFLFLNRLNTQNFNINKYTGDIILNNHDISIVYEEFGSADYHGSYENPTDSGVTFTKMVVKTNVKDSANVRMAIVYDNPFALEDYEYSSDYTIDDKTNILTFEKDINLEPGHTLYTSSMSDTQRTKDYRLILYDAEGNAYCASDDIVNANGTEGKYFKIIKDLDFNEIEIDPIGTSTNPFKGIVDGDFHVIKDLKMNKTSSSNLYVGLFGYVENATIKNIIISSPNISVSGSSINYAGTIVGYAAGTSKIYNCGSLNDDGTIRIGNIGNSLAYVGGLVGFITDSTVVTNCYNGTKVINENVNTNAKYAGVVGWVNGNEDNLNKYHPIVYLLVNYGTIQNMNSATPSGNYQFVYNSDVKILSTKTPTYCYYLFDGNTKDVSQNGGIQNYAISRSYDQLTSDGFIAHLNTYRYMVEYYLNDYTNAFDTMDQHKNDGYENIATWYISENDKINLSSLDKPLLKKYEKQSVDKYYEFKYSEKEASDAWGENNYLKVTLEDPTTNSDPVTIYSRITDMDEKNNDFVNRKIVIPFNSVSSKFVNNDTNFLGYGYTVSGWKLTKVKYDRQNINFKENGINIYNDYVLRKGQSAVAKDISSIYAEGGYYLVPDKVSEISLTVQWADTIYVADEYAEDVFTLADSSNTYKVNNNESMKYGSRSLGEGKTPDTPVGSIKDALNLVGNLSKATIYDVKIVLVGNYHFSPGNKYNNNDDSQVGEGIASNFSTWITEENDCWSPRAISISSIDADGDLVPDYSFYTRNNNIMNINGLRLDFINMLAIPQIGNFASDLNTWKIEENTQFDISETVVTDQMNVMTAGATVFKINGGWVNIFATNMNNYFDNKLAYIYFGGNARADFINFGSSSTSSGTQVSYNFPVINIAGGRVKELSSTYLSTVVDVANIMRFNIDGGYIDTFHVTYNGSLKKSAIVNINGSYINHYYAGGKTSSSNIALGVETNITDSTLGEIYGGPEYGSITGISSLYILNSTVNKLFGGGYGGSETTVVGRTTGIYNPDFSNENNQPSCNSSKTYSNHISLSSVGNVSFGANDTSRSYSFGRYNARYGIETGYTSQFVSAVGCPVGIFSYNYSNLSTASVDKVIVNFVDSTLNGEFYGGGNKGVVNDGIEVNIEGSTIKGSVYGGGLSNETETIDVYETLGSANPGFISYTIDSEATYPAKTTYTWTGDESYFSDSSRVNKSSKMIYSENVANLGKVNGEIYLNIKDSTITAKNSAGLDNAIYGGGNRAPVYGNVHVNLYGNNNFKGEVFGGANQALVKGNVDIRLMSGYYENAYAGSNQGNIIGEAMITVSGDDTTVVNLYGGGKNSSTSVTNIYAIQGSYTNIFGGSNEDGTIETTNINLGIIPTVSQKFSPEYPPVEEIEDTLIDGSVMTNSDYLPDNDTCEIRDIKYYYRFAFDYNWNFDFGIINNTDVDFDRFDVEILVSDHNGLPVNFKIGNRGDLTPDSSNYRLFRFNQNHNSIWIDGNEYTHQVIPANSSMSITTPSYDTKANITYTGSSDLPTLEAVHITASGIDSSGNRVYFDSDVCKDPPKPEVPADSSNPFEKSSKFTFVRPEAVTSLGLIKVTNLYGGNNAGGSVDHTNLVIDYPDVTITNVYGAGKGIKSVTGSTNVTIKRGTITDVYGGGENGQTGKEDISSDNVITKVLIDNATINGSVYGGGKGEEAVSYGSSAVSISGNSHIIGSVYGGGNAAKTGKGEIIENVDGPNTAQVTITGNTFVYIAGGTIDGSVYGGPDKSTVFGHTSVYVGYEDDSNLDSGPIVIGGSVFGGGHTNEEAAEHIDFTHTSVASGTDVVITESNKTKITINGSIFGSGDATCTQGESNIKIYNFGYYDTHPKTIKSIQRSTNLLIDNSTILIVGAVDSTNVFSTIPYSISRVQNVDLINNSTLYLKNNTNRVEALSSLKTVTGGRVLETATFDEDSNVTTNGVDNRIYMYPNIAVNLAKQEDIDEIPTNRPELFGDVNGMAFLGLFVGETADTINTGFYADNYTTGSSVTAEIITPFLEGSYVKGVHKTPPQYENNHDITVDGYFTNFVDDETSSVVAKVIDPIDGTNYYIWNVGNQSDVFKVYLTASKFTALGTTSYSLTLPNFINPNTTYMINAYYDVGLESGVRLVPCDQIPKVAATDEEALTTFGLKMETSIDGWVKSGKTEFYSPGQTPNMSGATEFKTDNTESATTFNFYLIHSQNITESRDLGYVLIKLTAKYKLNANTDKYPEFYFKVIMDTKEFDELGYDGNMTPGKEYELFTSKRTLITSTSSLSGYYSLYVKDDEEDESKRWKLSTGDRRVLASSYLFPVNTRITLVDRTDSANPTYYYYVVDEHTSPEQVRYMDITYNPNATFYLYSISDFIRMGSTSTPNKFDDELSNKNNYDPTTHISIEEFIFIVDFSEANITADKKNAEMFMQLIDSEGQIKASTIEPSRLNVAYSIYADKDANIDVDLETNKTTAYVGSDFTISSNFALNQERDGDFVIYDTNYIQDRMGLKLTVYDKDNNLVTGTNLLGTIFYIDGIPYSANLDGSVRIKISDSVANVAKNIRVDLEKSNLPSGNYTFMVEAFGSPDGLYYGLTSTGSSTVQVYINNHQYGLNIDIDEEDIIIDNETGKNINNTNIIDFNVQYYSQYTNPKLRFRLLRRKYADTEFIDVPDHNKVSLEYEEVDISTMINNSYTRASDSEYLYILSNSPQDNNSLVFEMKDHIPTGTYKLVVEFYDDDILIGKDYEYIFIK